MFLIIVATEIMENENNSKSDKSEVITDGDFKIYSKGTIFGFTFFFTTIFGGVLLMQNLRDIGRKKKANLVLVLSILFTILSMFIVNMPDEPTSYLPLLCNIAGGLILSEFFYKKYFPEDSHFAKKKIWKPLIISLLIMAPFLIAVLMDA